MKTLFSKLGWLSVALLINLFTSAQVWAEYEEFIYYHNDALGSPVMASDANGNVKWEEDYMPFGKRLEYQSQELVNGEPQEDAWDETVWYTGKQEETRLGLTHMGARWYDPLVGRFLSPDPVGFVEQSPMSFNRYVYVNNNPYTYVDPDGKFAIRAQRRLDTGAINYSIVFTPSAISYISEFGIALTPVGKWLKRGEKIIDLIPDRAGPLNPYADFSEIIEHDKEIVKYFKGKKNHNRNTLYTESELKNFLVDAFEESKKTADLYSNQRKLYGKDGGIDNGEVFDPVFNRAREKMEKSNDIHVKSNKE